MTRYVAALFAAWLGACSSDKPAESAYDASTDANTPAPASEPVLTPASSEAAGSEARDRRDNVDAVTTEPAAPASGSTAADPGMKASDTSATKATDTRRPGDPAPAGAADNTNKNERDRNAAAPTPGDQGENSTDLKITQRIRQALMGDGSLSFNAKNVKVITQNGRVTLRGPVRSQEERASVEAAARNVAGANNVDSQLEIAK
jgi:hypothetical protein